MDADEQAVARVAKLKRRFKEEVGQRPLRDLAPFDFDTRRFGCVRDAKSKREAVEGTKPRVFRNAG